MVENCDAKGDGNCVANGNGNGENNDQNFPIVFTSMGMFIIDEIHFPNQPAQYDVLGGGGTWGVVGSRVILSSKHSGEVGMIIDYGTDCPDKIKEEVAGWGIDAIIRENESRLTTRGWNMYGDNEFRSFKYLTPKKRIDVDDLVQYESLLNSKSFHLICSPERCIEIMKRLRIERLKIGNEEEPISIWEPIPDDCNPKNLERCLSILDKIDILSPNAAEASSFFGLSEPNNRKELEKIASKFIPYLTKKNSGIVLRCGKMGCYCLNNSGLSKWFPAYHHPLNPDYKVVDPTGAGNAFLGALATGFVKSDKNWTIACICGNIGSGLAIEQIGMPKLTKGDRWNGKTVQERFKLYLDRNKDIDFDFKKLSKLLDYNQ
ncbi:hypothetical protein PACTADRAFT_48959 [Pachysolen tannophilus NRRL Y-2460]|uniref:Carbohydrate kinase PfkB domain-containing protein n=1 Tax=Pachysolen tannophilus NRRL Y-2460 TaxID=669874 RepID=A0A1E4TZN8_PACTA|nr:hypothetical protein PACTADRAFT_48959 [Pachysolen tannophilus NRRL Y-2460]